jgi:hypothetical protein
MQAVPFMAINIIEKELRCVNEICLGTLFWRKGGRREYIIDFAAIGCVRQLV